MAETRIALKLEDGSETSLLVEQGDTIHILGPKSYKVMTSPRPDGVPFSGLSTEDKAASMRAFLNRGARVAASMQAEHNNKQGEGNA